jgi:hypothetical protein
MNDDEEHLMTVPRPPWTAGRPPNARRTWTGHASATRPCASDSMGYCGPMSGLAASDAFAAEPKVADDLGAAHHYNAACAAALACVGQGQDARDLDDRAPACGSGPWTGSGPTWRHAAASWATGQSRPAPWPLGGFSTAWRTPISPASGTRKHWPGCRSPSARRGSGSGPTSGTAWPGPGDRRRRSESRLPSNQSASAGRPTLAGAAGPSAWTPTDNCPDRSYA